MNAMSNVIDFDQANMLKAALAYAARGWHVLPCFRPKPNAEGNLICGCGKKDCDSPGKHPHGFLARRGQMDATTDPEVIRRWFAYGHQLNIAIQCSQSGLAVIDIDPRNGGELTKENIEAKYGRLYSDVEQFTGGGGQHYVYSNPYGVQGLPGKLGPGIDLKGNGYIMVWPSLHESGLLYEWEGSSDPTEGALPSPLPDWLRDLAGPQHDATATQGSRYAPPEQIEDIKAALAYLSADDYHDWINTGQALKAIGGVGFELWNEWSKSSSKYNGNLMGPKWRSFKAGAYQIESIFHQAMQAGWVNTTHFVKEADVHEIDASEIKFEQSATQKAAKKPDFIGDINNPRPKILNQLPVAGLQAASDWFNTLSNKPHPDASMLSAIALGCALAGRKYVSVQDNHPSLQLVMSGGSYIGKNYGKTGISRLLGAAGMPHLMSNEFYTHRSAIYTALCSAPNHICITDEFGECFMEARNSNSGNLNTVFKGLKSAYSDAGDYFRASAYADPSNKKKPVAYPSLTLLGLTTPEQFFGEITEHQIKGGTFNRFLVVNLTRELLQERQTITRQPPPDDLVGWVRDMRSGVSNAASDAMPHEVPSLHEIPFTKDADRIFAEFWDYVDDQELKLGESGQDSLVGRWRENAMRLATMLAACRSHGEGGKIIDGTLANFSCAYVRYHGLHTISHLSGQLSDQDSYWSKVVKIGAFIRQAGVEGRTRSDIIRKFRIKTRDLEEIFNTLAITEGMVKKVANPPGFAGTGRKAESYVIAGFILSED